MGRAAEAGVTSYRPNDDEAACAAAVAKRRNKLNSGQSNLPGGETATEKEMFLQHYTACLAEIAVSRVTNLCWTGCGVGATGLKDVGDMWQVRSISDPSRGLLVRPKDDDNDPIVLVYVDRGTRECHLLGWEFVGWVKHYGRAVDQETDRPCWIMPPDELRQHFN